MQSPLRRAAAVGVPMPSAAAAAARPGTNATPKPTTPATTTAAATQPAVATRPAVVSRPIAVSKPVAVTRPTTSAAIPTATVAAKPVVPVAAATPANRVAPPLASRDVQFVDDTSTASEAYQVEHDDIDAGASINSVSVSVSELEIDEDAMIEQEEKLNEEIEEKAAQIGLSREVIAQQLDGIVTRKVLTKDKQIVRRRFRPRNDEPLPPIPKIEIRGKLTSSPLPENFWGYELAFVLSFIVAFIVLLASSNIVGASISLGVFSAFNLVGAFAFGASYYLVRPAQNRIQEMWLDPFTTEFDRIQMVIKLMKTNHKMNFMMLIGMELALLTAFICVPVVCVDLEFFTLLNAASQGRKAVFVFIVLTTVVVVALTNYVQYYSYGWNVSCCTALSQHQKKANLSTKPETLYPQADTSPSDAAGTKTADVAPIQQTIA